MPRPRFTLRAVLICVTLCALVLGLAQWRNRFIRNEVDSLANSGCNIYTRISATDALEVPGIGLSEEWIDRLWQRRPNRGNITATDLGDGTLRLGQDTVGRDEFKEIVLSLQERLTSLGVERIFLQIDGQAPYHLPAWLEDFKRRSEMIVLFGDSGTSTYGPGGANPDTPL